MDPKAPLASCLVHDGTVTNPRDMVRALETIETLTYVQAVDGEVMAEPGSATILVNECLFLNVLSFRYLTFTTQDGPEGPTCSFELVGDGMTLTLVPTEDPETPEECRMPARLLEAEAFDTESYVLLDDEDDESGL
ncbi:MAG TPA: hypothetical protein VF902_09480 [Coriobacteriia bacterium]